MKLKGFQPFMNFLLCELHTDAKTKSGLLLPEDVSDRWLKVLKTGPKVENIKTGQYVLMNQPSAIEMTFEDGKRCLLFQEFNVCATYNPDKDEKQPFYAPTPEPKARQDDNGMNIIDNPGIDKGPWINEMPEA